MPRYPGVLSANGLLSAPVEHELSAAFPHPLAGLDMAAVRGALAGLDEGCTALMRGEAVGQAVLAVKHSADVCYVGQSYHLEIPLHSTAPNALERLYADFLVAHNRVYGHSTESPARIVSLRAVHQAGGSQTMTEGGLAPAALRAKSTRRILVAEHGWCEAAIWDRAALTTGQTIAGPAIVEQTDTTVLIEPGWTGTVHSSGSLILEQE
ncbi:MAG: hypothetical protein WDO24_02605 [Pseudomonadota bacterium]